MEAAVEVDGFRGKFVSEVVEHRRLTIRFDLWPLLSAARSANLLASASLTQGVELWYSISIGEGADVRDAFYLLRDTCGPTGAVANLLSAFDGLTVSVNGRESSFDVELTEDCLVTLDGALASVMACSTSPIKAVHRCCLMGAACGSCLSTS